MGVPYETFWHLSPVKLEAFSEAHRLKQKMNDEQMWIMGRYMLEALGVSLAHFGAGLAGKKSDAKYLEKPFLQDVEKGTNVKGENREEIAVFEAKQRVRLLKQQGLPESPM